MKSHLVSLVLFTLAVAAGAQEARRVRPGEFSALESAPTKQAPVFFSKGTASGPPHETSREYFSKGTLSTKSAIVRINLSDGSKKEEPYVEVPLLFKVGTTQLLDANSRANLADAITQVRRILNDSRDGCFRVEGHASIEGDANFNERLAAARAVAIQQELTRAVQVNEGSVHAEGRGTLDHQASANDPESMLQQDRKVLIVREK